MGRPALKEKERLEELRLREGDVHPGPPYDTDEGAETASFARGLALAILISALIWIVLLALVLLPFN